MTLSPRDGQERPRYPAPDHPHRWRLVGPFRRAGRRTGTRSIDASPPVHPLVSTSAWWGNAASPNLTYCQLGNRTSFRAVAGIGLLMVVW